MEFENILLLRPQVVVTKQPATDAATLKNDDQLFGVKKKGITL